MSAPSQSESRNRASSRHRLILASAGTGKTYQLTGRFLQILFDDVPPERILATTFTRKAAGEILDRVLRRLVDAAENEGDREALSEQLGTELSQERCRAKLSELLRGLDRLRVRTLDAFFVQLAKLFALDLGLPADWTIVEEAADEALRRDALARTLRNVASDELFELLRGLQQADVARSIENVLLRKVGQGRDAYLDSHADAWQVVQPPAGLDADELASLEARIAALSIPLTGSGSPRKRWETARRQLSELVTDGAWKKVPGHGIAKKLLAGEDEYDRAPIEADWQEVVATLLRQAAHEVLHAVAVENRAARTWLERFEQHYEALKREERAFRFDDLPKALHPREENRLSDQDLIWYRMDARIDHLLLDEFQDTAPVQWRLLANLAEEILADGEGERSFFCVGDVKQSIYGWREAEPRLLAEMHERYDVLQPEAMDESYRSSAVILSTVQSVFGSVGGNRVFEERPASHAAAKGFERDFGAHTAAKDLPGAAWLLQAPEPKGDEESFDPVLELCARRVREILDEAPRATVGVLLRRNDWVPRLIHLLRGQGVRASGEGGNPLVDSAAVLHLLSLLHLIDHPGDSAAAFHVATSPLGALVGLEREAFRDAIAKVVTTLRKRLAAEGYGAFCFSFQACVDRSYGPWDRKRFAQLVDLAYGFEDRAGTRTGAFLDEVRLTRVEDPTATQVQVMTVHASKGLEFDAVLLPELEGPLYSGRTPLFTHRPDPAGLLGAVSHSRGRSECALDPKWLGPLQFGQEEREVREALCLLYVAMTRARHRLDLLVPYRKDVRRTLKSHAGIVIEALAPETPPGPDGVLWSHPENSSPWHTPELAEALASDGDAPDQDVERTPRFAPRRSEPSVRRTPSAQEGDGQLKSDDLLRSPRAASRQRGTLIHRWLEEIEWLEDFALDDDALHAMGRALVLERRVRIDALAEFRTLLGATATQRLLSRPANEPDVTYEVWRERPFAVFLPAEDAGVQPAGAEGPALDTELWSGTFDRVVLRRRGGVLEGAHLIDFKTDRIEPDDLEERSAYYRPQMQGYARVLRHMTGLTPSAIEATLAFLHADRLGTLDLL